MTDIKDREAAATAEIFEQVMGGQPDAVYFAPGRVNLIGEHIDYNGGHVFPCALTLGTYGAIRRREDSVVRLYSANFPEAGIRRITVPAEGNEIAPSETLRGIWFAYPDGVLKAYAERGHFLKTGFDLVCNGNLPGQSGLSSSASLEVMIGCAISGEYDLPVEAPENACLGQRAENAFVGVNCGIMDQFSSALGKKDHAIFLECTMLLFRYAPLSLGDAKIVIVNTNKPHVLAGTEYNERRAQCEHAFAEFKALRPELPSLCALTPEDLPWVRSVISDDSTYRRVRHAITEEDRTKRAYEVLCAGDLVSFGQLMKESHISLRDDFEVSCRELDILSENAWEMDGVIGMRMTGGGFGGCTVGIVKNDALADFEEKLGRIYREAVGYDASFYVVTAGDGARRVI